MQNKTAVQTLIDYIEENYHLTEESRLEFKKTLQMEKQQIINAYDLGSLSEMQLPNPKTVIENGEQYYNSTYPELPTEPTKSTITNHIPMGGCI